MKLKIRLVFLVFLICILWFLTTVGQHYFRGSSNQSKVDTTTWDESHEATKIDYLSSLKLRIEQKAKEPHVKQLFEKSSDLQRKYDLLLNILKNDLLINNYNNYNHYQQLNYTKIWRTATSWIHSRQVLPKYVPELGSVLKSLETAPIIKAETSKKGTQLKVLLTLFGGQKAFFKPKRYQVEEVIRGSPYAGYDRYNGEIAAFHLSRLLNLRFVPITAGRRIHVQNELKPVASKQFLKTFVTFDNWTSNCFYGKCHYCNPKSSVCPDENGFLDGAVILLMPNRFTLSRLRSPWQRTYKDNLLSKWETDPNYCENEILKHYQVYPRLLDLIDTSIFDYLIGNADRHHYEVFRNLPNSGILLIDNGKSFGNPYWDELTILAPLYQCCLVRKSTYDRLLLFAATDINRGLSKALSELYASDALNPLLSEPNLIAVDRRLKTIITLVNVCFEDKGNLNEVLR